MDSEPDGDSPRACHAPGSRWDDGLFRAWYASVISAGAEPGEQNAARLWWERISVRYLVATNELLLYEEG